jgi:hypothetical protein
MVAFIQDILKGILLLELILMIALSSSQGGSTPPRAK